MRSRRTWLVLGLILIPAAASADDHRADLFAAMCFAKGSTLVGYHHAYAVSWPAEKYEDMSVVGDFSVNFGSDDGNDATQVPFLVGVRRTFAWLEHQKAVPFGQFLVGGVYTNDGVSDGTDLAFAFGGGLEFLPARGKDNEGWGARLQFDYIIRPGDADDVPRFSAGVVYRFKKPPPTP